MKTAITAAATAALITTSSLSAGAGSFSGAEPFAVKKVQLTYSAEKDSECPRTITMKARATTNGPGTVKFVIRKAGGGKSADLAAQAVKGSDGKYVATYVQHFDITKNTETKYMAEVVGAGKISGWVDFNVTCGPQVRTETKTKGAPKRTGKHISELDKDPKPSNDGKPLPTNDGKPLPSDGGKPIPTGGEKQLCKGEIRVTRYLAATKDGGLTTAWIGWSHAAKKKYGKDYASSFEARDRKEWCTGVLTGFTCTVAARPCHS